MIKVNRHILKNGLRIVHSEDTSTRMVALNILYNVGARDEHPGRTGLAHLSEHLMFGGSINIPDYDTPVQIAGGENNAWTNNDMTNYYITLPYSNAEIGFWLESDRMLSLDFNEKGLEIQKNVVVEEFMQRNLNQPYGDVQHILRDMAYKTHPYRWPTIGKETSHIANTTLDEVKDFFRRFYAPNNAILAVSGNISFAETIRLAEKWFGDIPTRKIAPRKIPSERPQTKERRMTVLRNVPVDMLYMAFHICGRKDSNYHTFDAISDMLCNGRSSRLIRRLVNEEKTFSSIDAYVSGSIDDGLLYITGKPSAGTSLEEAEKAVWMELEKLKRYAVGKVELEKVKNRYESEMFFSNTNYLNVAANLAFFELMGKAEDINEEVSKYRSVTPKQITNAARKCFVPTNCNILYYRKASDT